MVRLKALAFLLWVSSTNNKRKQERTP